MRARRGGRASESAHSENARTGGAAVTSVVLGPRERGLLLAQRPDPGAVLAPEEPRPTAPRSARPCGSGETLQDTDPLYQVQAKAHRCPPPRPARPGGSPSTSGDPTPPRRAPASATAALQPVSSPSTPPAAAASSARWRPPSPLRASRRLSRAPHRASTGGLDWETQSLNTTHIVGGFWGGPKGTAASLRTWQGDPGAETPAPGCHVPGGMAGASTLPDGPQTVPQPGRRSVREGLGGPSVPAEAWCCTRKHLNT